MNRSDLNDLDLPEIQQIAEECNLKLEQTEFASLHEARDALWSAIRSKARGPDEDDEDEEEFADDDEDEGEDPPTDPAQVDAGTEVGRLMDKFLDAHPDATESQALGAVLRQNPELRKRYEDSFGSGKGRMKT